MCYRASQLFFFNLGCTFFFFVFLFFVKTDFNVLLLPSLFVAFFPHFLKRQREKKETTNPNVACKPDVRIINSLLNVAKKGSLKEDCRHDDTREENNFCRVTPEADLSDENGNTYCKITGHLNIPVSGQTCNANNYDLSAILFTSHTSRCFPC